MDTSGSEPKRRNVKELNYVVTDELSKTGFAMTHHLLENEIFEFENNKSFEEKENKI